MDLSHKILRTRQGLEILRKQTGTDLNTFDILHVSSILFKAHTHTNTHTHTYTQTHTHTHTYTYTHTLSTHTR